LELGNGVDVRMLCEVPGDREHVGVDFIHCGHARMLAVGADPLSSAMIAPCSGGTS